MFSYCRPIYVWPASTMSLQGSEQIYKRGPKGRVWMVDGGWCPTFCFFKSLDINMVYTSDIYINYCREKILWVSKFGEVGELAPNF